LALDGDWYRIAALEDSLRMKRRAGRPQDVIDIEHREALKPGNA
jgi:hypothetical protein